MSGNIKITEPNGRDWDFALDMGKVYSSGRAKDNDIVLNDRRVSRKHAHIAADGALYKIVDGYFENGELKRSVNHVFVNGSPMLEKPLAQGDMIVIGESRLEFFQRKEFEKHLVSLAPSLGNTPIAAARKRG